MGHAVADHDDVIEIVIIIIIVVVNGRCLVRVSSVCCIMTVIIAIMIIVIGVLCAVRSTIAEISGFFGGRRWLNDMRAIVIIVAIVAIVLVAIRLWWQVSTKDQCRLIV